MQAIQTAFLAYHMVNSFLWDIIAIMMMYDKLQWWPDADSVYVQHFIMFVIL